MSGPFWRQFSLKITIWGEKRAPKNCSKKGAPPYANKSLFIPIPMLGGSWRSSLAYALFEQETIVWARNSNNCSFLSPVLSRCPGMGYFWVDVWKIVNFLMESETKKRSNCRSFCSLYLFQRLVIWHALGQGPANIFERTLEEKPS